MAEPFPPYFQLRSFTSDGSEFTAEVYDDTENGERIAYDDFALAMQDEDVASATLCRFDGENVATIAVYNLAGIAERES